MLALGILLVVACDRTPPAPAPTASPRAPQLGASTQPTAAGRPGTNTATGLGEARIPEPFTLDQRLLDAVRRNDRPTMDRALELGARIQAKDDLGRSTLFLAVMDAQSLELVRWLHEKGLSVDEADVSGRTPLSFAAADGQIEIVRYLVDKGAKVDTADVQKRTPLMHASGANHPEVITFLVDHGAELNARDQFGDTPIFFACGKGNVASATVLLQRGADTTIRDQEGRTVKERSAPEADPCLRLPD